MIYFTFKFLRRSRFFTAACFFFFSLSFYPTDLLAEDKPVGRILAVNGTVKYFVGKDSSASGEKPGEVKLVAFEPWQNVKKRQPVYATDKFRTGRKSRLKILFSDNSLMALGPGAEMLVDAYRTQPKSKLRQGVVNVKRGLAMYLVNKSQNNKKSFFNIVTPAANLGARGTQGYVAVSDGQTLVANQAGAVAVKSSDPDIDVQVNVGSMMKTKVSVGAPPAPPTPLLANELATFRALVVGDIAFSGGPENSLISVEEGREKKEKEEEEKEGDEKGGSGSEGEGDRRTKAFRDMTREEKEEMKEKMEKRMDMRDERRKKQGLRPLPRNAEAMEQFEEEFTTGGRTFSFSSSSSSSMTSSSSEFNFETLSTFETGVSVKFGTAADFQESFTFFSDVDAESCSF
jgi:hypothetical protein|tara:strand:+ start:4368 stop:5570 length:1203 start_codon:yes stop_codon:yes gene_type:complete